MSKQREESASPGSRRSFLGTLTAAAALTASSTSLAQKKKKKDEDAPKVSLAASPPIGFVPFASPGRIVKVTKGNTLQPNGLWPLEEPAKMMVERALTELTGENDLVGALGRFFHKEDKVAIKVNGIAGQKGQTMGTNKEMILPVVQGLLALGIPAENMWVYEQYPSFLAGTRINDKVLPAGVKSYTHNNDKPFGGFAMDPIVVEGIETRFTRFLVEATAVINFSLIKDHSICGYTGMLKNMTHGSTVNPHDFHAHTASPQIAHLYAQEIIKTRTRLCITDGYKLMFEGGPLDRRPDCRIPHESVYVSTDPVAMDTIGAQMVDKARQDKGIKSLKDAKRDPTYIKVAAQLGLGIADLNQIRMREVSL